jgi:hypothetical protein
MGAKRGGELEEMSHRKLPSVTNGTKVNAYGDSSH